MNVWFTSDLHLGHGNIIKFCGRPFMTPAEEAEVRRHDEGLIEAINPRVVRFKERRARFRQYGGDPVT